MDRTITLIGISRLPVGAIPPQLGTSFCTCSAWNGVIIKGIFVPPFIGDGQDSHLFTEFLLLFDFLFDIIIEQVFYNQKLLSLYLQEK